MKLKYEVGKFEKCKKCETYHWNNKKCPPIFYFKHENWGNEFQKVRAYGFHDAALKFAGIYNKDDQALINNAIEVIISNGKIEKKYIVSAEIDICYSINEIKD